jgi:hypothetical protein
MPGMPQVYMPPPQMPQVYMPQPQMPQMGMNPAMPPQPGMPQVSYAPPPMPQVTPPQVTVPPVAVAAPKSSNTLLIVIFCLLAFLAGAIVVYLLVKPK